MRQFYIFISIFAMLGINMSIFAQTDPGITHLKHRWTFDNGSLTDEIGGVTGTIVGDGTLANNAFVSTNAYLNLPASQIGINSYPGLSIEVWCTSAAGKNTGWTMLSYFGETVSGGGKNCTFLSIARAVDGSMATLETSVWNGATGPEYDDGKLHHFAYTVDEANITLFIDGVLIGTSPLTTGNTLSNVSTSLGYLGRGGWTGDPNWIGSYQKFSIYNKALTGDEILFLYQEGAEKQAVISPTVTSLAFDNNYPAETFNVTGANLSGSITVSAPVGISLMNLGGNQITSLPATATDELIVAVWDTNTPVDGNITLSSGGVTTRIPVKTTSDINCYHPIYTESPNIVEDMGLNDLAKFPGGWGTRSVVNIVNNPESVYCGASSIKIGDGINTASGSLNIELTGKLIENTTYRVKTMIKTIGGSFQLGVLGWDAAQGDLNFVIDTKGEWMALDTVFTTGVSLSATQWMFINNYLCTGTVAFADNWEMYPAQEPILTTSVKTLAYDPEFKVSNFNVTAANLSNSISITCPSGISADPATLPAEAAGAVVTITWDGTTPVNDIIALSSGTTSIRIPARTTAISNVSCFVPLYTDKPNLIPDPYLNNPALFLGWGGKGFVSIADNPDSVYCGSHSGVVVGSGSMDVSLVNIIKKNTHYVARVMVMTIGGSYQLGVGGYDVNGAGADINSVIDTQGAWLPVSVEFTTGDSLRVNNQPLFVNNWELTGKRVFMDNWELYELPPNALPFINAQDAKIFVQNGKIIAEVNLIQSSKVEFEVYNVQGALIANEIMVASEGKTTKQLNAITGTGVYIVKMTVDGKSSFSKIIR